jgi:hypothetical protein
VGPTTSESPPSPSSSPLLPSLLCLRGEILHARLGKVIRRFMKGISRSWSEIKNSHELKKASESRVGNKECPNLPSSSAPTMNSSAKNPNPKQCPHVDPHHLPRRDRHGYGFTRGVVATGPTVTGAVPDFDTRVQTAPVAAVLRYTVSNTLCVRHSISTRAR